MERKITIRPVTEENLSGVLGIKILPEQEGYVLSPAVIISRAWANREKNAEVHVICADEEIAGMALTYDVTEEPACHFLMEFIVDEKFQRQGVGCEAMGLIIEHIKSAPRFDMIELSVDRKNTAAIGLYEKCGFADSGYVDPELPQYINMIYKL